MPIEQQYKEPTLVAEPPSFHDLLRQLTEMAASLPATHPASPIPDKGAASEVLFDLCINNERYVLTRLYHPPPSQPKITLSPREKEIVRLVAKGLSNKAIGAVLEISPWTVSTYLRRVFSKLTVGSRAEMVARALEEGLLVMDDEEQSLPGKASNRRP